MKVTGITRTALLSLLFGTVAHGYGLHEQQGEKQDHPDKPQAAQHEQAKPEQQQQQHAPQQQQHAPQQQDQNKQQHAQQQHAQQQQQHTQEQQRAEQTAWQQHRAGNWQSDHLTWQQRGGYSGYRIPNNRFDGYFGPGHAFRIEGLPFLVVGGYPRFQYAGYWFSLVDPWPGYWANNWYDTDDVYVNYVDNGYYLFNRRYPTVGIAVSISM